MEDNDILEYEKPDLEINDENEEDRDEQSTEDDETGKLDYEDITNVILNNMLNDDINNDSDEESDTEDEDDSKDVKKNKDFKIIVKDFIKDIILTFPELYDNLDINLKNIYDNEDYVKESNEIMEYIKQVYPERFFDILYKNDSIFNDYEINTKFLPNIDFSLLWNDKSISDSTRDIIWKYLQLILFTIIGDLDHGDLFGDSAKIFESIDETELKDKLEETINSMQDLFDLSAAGVSDLSGDGLPNPDEIHDHLNTLMGGKLGNLAKEIAEETVDDLNLDINDETNPEEVMGKLFKNPKKLMNLVSNVSSKLDSKIKSGDIKESELVEEAAEMMDKIKNMPGMDKMESLFKNMAGQQGGKVNMGAMKSQLDKNLKTAKMRERMQKKLSDKREASVATPLPLDNKEPETLVFSTGEKVEKSLKKKNKKKKR